MPTRRIPPALRTLPALLALAGLWQWRVHEADGSAALARGLAALDAGDARTARIELMNAIRGNPASLPALLEGGGVDTDLDPSDPSNRLRCDTGTHQR